MRQEEGGEVWREVHLFPSQRSAAGGRVEQQTPGHCEGSEDTPTTEGKYYIINWSAFYKKKMHGRRGRGVKLGEGGVKLGEGG